MTLTNIDGFIESHDTIKLIEKTIADYKEQLVNIPQREAPSPFKHIVRKIQALKGTDDISNKEIMEFYLSEMKKDMMKNFNKEEASSSKTMSISSQLEEEEENVSDEAQNDNTETVDENYINNVLAEYKQEFQIEESSSKLKDKRQ
ncbi:hypothetical protein L1987_24464 [Smallanthus sonchifolius]|uniref:Uncharacterized protein n=1 Tax=Smallanthus sonchifolius TaxID=185202 RepID=A0ACB9ILE6_9ASTR|nr:hypothetical protein L1987_24464 [Smallanthus sonchifolius]